MTSDVMPAAGTYRSSSSLEPYRATRLWNHVIKTVYNGLPLARHRRYMKAYAQCFVAADAITWLHKQLQHDPNFGTAVTRNQTMQLFQKFHAARIFEDVRGVKHNSDVFADNGRLFRFVDSSQSPVATHRPAIRNPLATCNAALNRGPGPVKGLPGKIVGRRLARSDSHLVSTSQPTPKEVEYVWKMVTLKWLQRLLRRSSLDDILDTCQVQAPNIIHNMTQVNKNGIVTNIDQCDQLPEWVLSAMRCLAYWPETVDGHLPDYPGFQKDVFNVVKEYFDSPVEPLLTFSMYEAFTNVVVCAEGIGQPHPPAWSQTSSNGGLCSNGGLSSNSGLSSNGGLSHALMTSVENLIMNMTMDKHDGNAVSEVRPQDIIIVHDPCVAASTGRIYRYESVSSMPGAKLETSFGVDSVEPHTHVYPLPEQWDSASLDAYCKDASRSSSQHKSMSLMDVNNVTPAPENTLGSHVSRDSLASVASSTHSGTCARTDSYGYLVVISKATDVDCRDADCGMPPGERAGKLQPNLSNAAYRYERSNMPPPYKPPPSYTSVHCISGSASGERSMAQHKASNKSQRTMETGEVVRSLSLKRNLTESFRRAIESSRPASPSRHALLSTLKRSTSSPSVLNSTVSRNCVIECLQTSCLLLPPANRRKLHLLLRLMNKMVNNSRLQMEEGTSTRKLVLEQLSGCILRPRDVVDSDDVLTRHIVELMMDNYTAIMRVPVDLKERIEDKLTWLMKSKVYCDDGLANVDSGSFENDDCQKKMTFCERVTVSEYEHQKLSSSQGALQDLLDGIVKNKEMTLKNKKKHLKLFRRSYPDIYCQRFPTSESESNLFPDKPKIKPALFGRPLQKLRSLRL